jgi:hypothetical protein
MLDAWICHAIETELSDLRNKSNWRAVSYGLYSGIRLAYEPRYVAHLNDTANDMANVTESIDADG